MRNIVILTLVVLSFTACATKNDVAVTDGKIIRQTERTDDLIYEMKDKSLKIQEVSTKMAILELENRQNSKEYISLKEKLDGLRQEMLSLSERLDKIEKNGKENEMRISKMSDGDTKSKEKNKKLKKELLDELKTIENKYYRGGTK